MPPKFVCDNYVSVFGTCRSRTCALRGAGLLYFLKQPIYIYEIKSGNSAAKTKESPTSANAPLRNHFLYSTRPLRGLKNMFLPIPLAAMPLSFLPCGPAIVSDAGFVGTCALTFLEPVVEYPSIQAPHRSLSKVKIRETYILPV